MRFETRTVGVFEVLSVHLEADQAFDAGRLRQETLRLVEKGLRRIVVDLGPIDYLYSDSINAFVALNRRLLESSGRLGVLVPHPKVHEILIRAGLENIMRLYRNEAELLGDSREFMRQSSAWTRPVELLNEASASQIISAASLLPRSGTAHSPDTPVKPNQRTPRNRTGPRTEVHSRRQGGRRLDQPAQEVPLPPILPGVGNESSSFRALSRESSSFNLHSPSEKQRNTIPPVQPPTAPGEEPSVFELPKDSQNNGYSTDAWLLALGEKQTLTDPKAADQDSSSFLPKLPGTESEDSQTQPISQMETDLRWEEEIPLTDAPLPHVARNTPAPAQPAVPPVAPSGSNDALNKAIFHDHAPIGSGSKSPTPSSSPKFDSAQDAGDPTIVLPTMIPPSWDTNPRSQKLSDFSQPGTPGSAGKLAQDWFGKPSAAQAPVQTPAPAQTKVPPPPPLAPSPAAVKSSSAAEDWFGKPSTPQAPVQTPAPAQTKAPPPPPPTPSPAAVKSSSAAEDWFNHPSPRSFSAQSDRPSETDSWFGKSTTPSHSPAPSPDPAPPSIAAVPSKSDDPWFAQGPAISPVVPIPLSEAAPAAADWFKDPAIPSTAVNKPTHRKAAARPLETSDDLEVHARKRKGLGFWVAVFTGILLLLAGGGVWLVGFPGHRSSDLPPVTTPSATTPPSEQRSAPSASLPATQAPSSIPKPGAEPRKDARPEVRPDANAKTVAPTATTPPPEEDHAPVKIFVTSRPSGASLSLDGKSEGTTPCEITVRHGGNLQFSLSGYRTLQKAIDPDEVHGTLNVQLLPDGGAGGTGRIYISSAPSGADILLNGKALGKTPKLLELPTGSQKITVKSGVQSQTRTLDIQSGTNQSENFSL